MAVSLVTGYTGTEHVTSGQDGARQAGTVGTGMYALETVDEPLKATLENANTVTVGPGDVLINGRHVQLTGSTTFAIPVGTQAQQTSNLLVLRYARDDSGVETVQALTLTGDPAASDPQDPALATGSILDGDTPVDMPLYRVITTGIETAQPLKLFSTIAPLIDLPGASGEPLPISLGGTGATTANAARSNLGLDGQTGYLKAGRGNISDLSRNTLYNLAPGTYLVSQNASGGPTGETGYANLLTGYSAGNRVMAILTYDNGDVYIAYGESSSGNLPWMPVGGSRILYWGDVWIVVLAGNIILVIVHSLQIGSGSWDSVTCPYTLPEQYHPISTSWAPLATANGGSTTGVLQVETDGKIKALNYGSSGTTNERFGICVATF